MNKQISFSKLSKANLSSIKLPKGITFTQIALAAINIVLLALVIYFAVSYFGVVSKRTGLNRDIVLKQQQINSIGELQNIDALNSQLATAQQDLIDKSPFPVKLGSLDVVGQILEAAQDAHLTCIQYTPSNAAPYTINGHSYVANRYSITSTGVNSAGEKLIRIIKFLQNIEELPYNAISISDLTMTQNEGKTWTVAFTLSILSQQ